MSFYSSDTIYQYLNITNKKWKKYFNLVFKQTLQFLQQINVKNVHLVYGAGIQTHNFQNMSLLP